MKATTLLEHQHRKVEAIFKKLEGGKGDAQTLVVALANDLAAHMVIEQEIFYPAVKSVKKDLVLESYEEHAIAQFALKRLLETKPASASFQARVVALKELIEHHVEEEESDLFPEVEEKMVDELDELGRTMKARFDEVVEAGYASALAIASKSKDPPTSARSQQVR
jgi:hemerythrin-like domain-containing protein